MDHRVEPPAWLPQGAAPEAADPKADESPAVEDAQATEDSNTAATEAAPEEFSNSNGHESAYSYSSPDAYRYGDESAESYRYSDENPESYRYSDESAESYRYSDDTSFAEGTTYRSPFSPHRPAGSSYAPGDSESAADQAADDGLPGTDPVGGGLPASGLATSSDLPPSDLPPSDMPGSDLPATGLTDPDMPEVGFPHAAAVYSDTVATSYNDRIAIPYPATEPMGSASRAAGTDSRLGSGSDSGSGGSDSGSGGSDNAMPGRGVPLGAAAATVGATVGATMGGIGAALRSGKRRGAARFSRGGSATRSRSATRQSATRQPANRQPASRPRSAAGQPRRASLVIARIEPWSVMKFSFLISLVLWLVMFVAVALLYYALSSLGVFAALQRTLASVTSSQGSAGVDLTKWTSATRVLGYTMLLGAVNVVLITAISTVGAVIYNLVTHLGGGIEVTLKESE